MPIASAMFYNFAPGGEDDIRLAGQSLGMKAVAVSELVQDFPDRQLRLRVLADVRLHVTAAAGCDAFEDRAGRLAWFCWRGHAGDMKHEGTQREKRWAVITSDGSHSWLGRHTDPTEEEITRAADQLAAQGLTGWLAVTEGVYYEPTHPMTAIMVRALSGGGNWETSWTAFLIRRAEAIGNSRG